MGQKLVHQLFRRVSGYPEELEVNDFAKYSSQGACLKDVVSPRQLFFVPVPGIRFSPNGHDVRDDFTSIPEGTTLYQLHALVGRHAGFDYTNYTPETAIAFRKETEHVADIVTTSRFIASEFGDDGIFFRHQLRP